MSNSPSTLPRERLEDLRDVLLGGQLTDGVELLFAPLRFVAFWAAVALPFLYLPLLVGGLESNEITVFAGLVALNAVALLVGHNYAQS